MPGASSTASGALGSLRNWRSGPALLWLVAALGFAAAWGIGSALLSRLSAPLGLFPLVVGGVLGLVLALLLRATRQGHRRWALGGTVAAAVVAVTAWHATAFRLQQRAASRAQVELQQAAQAFPELGGRQVRPPPASLLEFLQQAADEGRQVFAWRLRGAAAYASWTVDGLLLLAAALYCVRRQTAQPWCAACEDWLRTTRSGRAPATVWREVRDLWSPPLELGASDGLSYAVASCRGGCSAWRATVWDASGQARQAWLEADGRARLFKALESATSASNTQWSEHKR